MIEGVEIKKLKKIVDERGFLMEMLRYDDKIFERFGQAYISACLPGVAKAWHYHKKQTDNLVIILGNAKVVLYDNRKNSKTKGDLNEFIMGEKNLILLKVPPLIIHGFSPIGNRPAYLINFPTLPYNRENPDEGRITFDSKEIPYDWKVKIGG